MARPKKAVAAIRKTVLLPPEVIAQVDLALYSELEGRVPHAAWQQLLTSLLEQWLERIKVKEASHG